MESVGQELRHERARLALTLEQVSAKTRIPFKNLQAIENDDLATIGSPFFYKSFVRQFAEFLNVDYSRLSASVQSAASTMPQPLVPGERNVDPPNVQRLRVRSPRNLRWLYSLASLVLMLAGCSTLYAIWQNAKSDWHASVDNFVQAITPKTKAPRVEGHRPGATHGRAASQQTARVRQVPEQQPQETDGDSISSVRDPAPEAAAFHIELSALEQTWLSIIADGKETFTGILEADDTKVLEGHEMARIRTGNAGGLSLVFNGKAIGSIGARGQVRTVVFTKDDYQVLEPSPHIALTRFDISAE